MKNFFLKLRGLWRHTGVWTLCIVMALGLCIWLVGPLLAVADYRIWDSSTARLVTISLLLLGWGVMMATVGGRAVPAAGGQATQAEQELASQNVVIAQERAELVARFEDAERILGQSVFYARQGKWSRRELPWYLLIGPQNSGKTSLLDFSGLDFPLNRVERRLTRDTRGSHSCHWYFTDQAVILDTAGRFFSHPRTHVDGSAWMNLLGLLRSRRRARAINGVLVTLPVEELLDGSELRIEALACTVRERLQDVHRRLRIDAPVYLLLSRADAIPGFDEFFDQLSREETEQVLGTTFTTGQNGSDAALVKQTFEDLLARLNAQVLNRVHQERGVERRGLVLDFPSQLGRIGENLCLFVELAFAGNRYQRAASLRGYYLTRAPHVSYSASEAAEDSDARIAGEGRRLPVLNARRARFIHDLLGKVIFRESSLAVPDKQLQRRQDWKQRAGFSALAGILLMCGALWTSGFSANHDRLERLRTLGEQLLEQRAGQSAQDDLLALLPVLDTLFEATQVFPSSQQAGLVALDGLYQGEPVNRTLYKVYESELLDQMLPRITHQLEAQLRADRGDHDRLLASLRAYLMLNLNQKRERLWLTDRIAADWTLRYPGQREEQARLNGHLQRLFDLPFDQPLNPTLVAEARQKLRGQSLAAVVYREMRDQARGSPDYRLGHHLGAQDTVFTGTDHSIPGFYTRQGYERYFLARGADAVAEILRDDWVLGDSETLGPLALRKLLVELEQLYFQDYATHWADAVGRVTLQPFENSRQGAAQMMTLGAAGSPMLRLLSQVREHTRFAVPAEVEPPQQTPAASAVTGSPIASAAVNQVKGAAAKALPDTAKRSLQRRFEPLHRLLDENGGPAADLIPVLQALSEVQQQLASLGRSGQPEAAAFDMAKARMGGQRDGLGSLRTSAAALPQPIGAWFTRLSEDSWAFVLQEAYRHVNQRYQDEVYSFYGQALDNRYPFHAHSSSDVALNDFREFFKAHGIAERFFDSYLKSFVTGEPGRYRLRSVDGYSVPMSHAWLEQMSNVLAIRKSFFAHAADEPQVRFKLEPYTLDPTVSRAEFRLGDQVTEYRHGPILATSFKWPVEVDDGRAALVLDRTDGRPVGIEKNTGPWSLFRLFDLMETEALHGRDVRVLKAEVGGLRANYLLMSKRSPDPFDLAALRRFRLPAQL